MMRKSLIDDVSFEEEPNSGDPIIFQNPEIRKMLSLAATGANDIFCDLGSGWAQNIIIALTEFHVKQAIGIEDNGNRWEMALRRLKRWSIVKERYKVINEDFEDLLDDKLEDFKLANATVIFYGLETSRDLIDKIALRIQPDTRLLYYYNCVFPEILPDDHNFPFFVSRFPFRKPTSELQWISSIVRKDSSSLGSGKLKASELWDELKHDYEVSGDPDDVSKYQKRLASILAK